MISIIRIKQNVELYEISFPYDRDLVDIIKQVPGRIWHPQQKFWTIKKNMLGFFLNQIKGTKYESQVELQSQESIGENAELSTTNKIPDIDIKDVNFTVKEGLHPFKHQLDFMKYAIHRQKHERNFCGFLCADEMGLTKTCEALNLAIYNKDHYNFRRCLVICCVNSGKYNWLDEIRKHTNGAAHPYLIGTRKRRDGRLNYLTGSKEKLADLKLLRQFGDKLSPKLPFFCVINIEALRMSEKVVVNKKRKTVYPIADRLIELINKGEFSMIIVDEIHKNASPTSVQGKQLLRIKDETHHAAFWLPMTGTPITKKPTDLYAPLKLIDAHSYPSYYKWCQEFCIYGGYGGHEVIAYKNIPKLKYILDRNMIRRKTSEVLDLPDIMIYNEYIDNTPYQTRLYQSVEADIIMHRDEIIESLNPATRFMRLRQVNGSPELVDDEIDTNDKNYLSKYNAKMQRIMELLEDYVEEQDQKVVIFSNWVEPLKTLYKFVSNKYTCGMYTGAMSDIDREAEKQRFINDPNCKVLLGTIGALGTTHTLTCAVAEIFLDEPWNPSDMDQAIKRINRPGTTQTSKIHILVSRDTVDERVREVLETKKGISEYMVDGQMDMHKNPQLFDLLLSHK